MAKDTKTIETMTDVILNVFRLNAQLLEHGDKLVNPLGLTSARWQVLGAIALADEPQTAPQIAELMGLSRQGVQKQLNLAIAENLVELLTNPRHKRSPLHVLSAKGRVIFDDAMVLQRVWAKSLVQGISLSELQSAGQVLSKLANHLSSRNLS